MKLTRKQFEEIKEFAEKQTAKNDPFHQLFHIRETAKFSAILAKKEKADLNKSIVIAWLHDICKYKEKDGLNHGDEGARLARPLLSKLGFEEQDIDDICYAIQQHNKGGEKKIIEAAIIWDADKIQAVGPYGLLRNYGYNTHTGINQEKAYKDNMEKQEFFLERFRTKSGLKIAKKQHKFMQKFHKNYLKIKNGNF